MIKKYQKEPDARIYAAPLRIGSGVKWKHWQKQREEKDMKKTYILDGLCCAHCAAEIENNVKKMEGVDSAAVSSLTTKLVIETAEEPSEDMMKKLKKIVKKVDSDITVKEA